MFSVQQYNFASVICRFDVDNFQLTRELFYLKISNCVTWAACGVSVDNRNSLWIR